MGRLTVRESALARQLVELVLAHAAETGARAVRRVDGWVAQTERLSPESLRLHFEQHAEGTAAARAELNLRLVHVRVRCDDCGREYPPEHQELICPRCGHVGGTLLERTGVGIDAVEADD